MQDLFIVTSTWRAGDHWFGKLLASCPQVAVRHNFCTTLSEPNQIFCNIKKLSEVAEVCVLQPKYRNGFEEMHIRSSDFSLADHFQHFEDNYSADVYGMTALSVSDYETNLKRFPEQRDRLTSLNFRVGNLVMDPHRAIDANLRYWTIEGQIPAAPLQAVSLRDRLLETAMVEGGDDAASFCDAVIVLSCALAWDAAAAEREGVSILPLEKLLTDRAYYLDVASELTNGRAEYDPSFLDTVYDPGNAHLCSPKSGLETSHVETGVRRPYEEGREIYEAWPVWRQEIVQAVLSGLDLYETYAGYGYDFSYMPISSPRLDVLESIKDITTSHDTPAKIQPSLLGTAVRWLSTNLRPM